MLQGSYSGSAGPFRLQINWLKYHWIRADREEDEGTQGSGRRNEMRLERADKSRGGVTGERQNDGWRHEQERAWEHVKSAVWESARESRHPLQCWAARQTGTYDTHPRVLRLSIWQAHTCKRELKWTVWSTAQHTGHGNIVHLMNFFPHSVHH